MNKVTEDLPAAVQATLYVDDLAIYFTCSYAPTAERLLQRSVNQISRWASRSGFTLAPEKTLGCIFYRGRQNPPPPNVVVSGQEIEFKASVKFLGMILDSKLKWQEHIESLRTRCLLAMNVLKATAHLSWGGDRCTLLRLYRALIRSKIDY